MKTNSHNSAQPPGRSAPAPMPNIPPLAVPSWIIPGGIVENARLAAGRTAEVGLCFFETESCLAYGPEDLPPDLAGLPLTWHVHLPLDLPWLDRAGKSAAEVALRLMDKVAFLDARRAVLHLPEGLARPGAAVAAKQAWRDFAARWQDSGRSASDLLVENQPGDDPQILLELAETHNTGLCLDASHWLMTLGPETLPDKALLRRVGLLHLNAPGQKATGHASLTALSPAEQAWTKKILRQLAAARSAFPYASPQNNPLIMLEIFSWDKILSSLPLLEAWLAEV